MTSTQAIEEFKSCFEKVGLETRVLELESAISDNTAQKVEHVQEFFREVHSLKGTASMLNFDSAAHFLHAYEDVIGLVNSSVHEICGVTNRSLFDFLLKGLDLVDQLVVKFASDSEAPLKDDKNLLTFYVELLVTARRIVTSADEYFNFVELREELF